MNRLINPFRPSCCNGCWTLVPFRGGDTSPSKEVSFRGDCWLRKRNSSIRSLVLFEYAIFMCYNTTDNQLVVLFSKTRAKEKASRWGLQQSNCLPPKSTSASKTKSNRKRAVTLKEYPKRSGCVRPGGPGAQCRGRCPSWEESGEERSAVVPAPNF